MDETPLSFGEQNFGIAMLGNRSRISRLVRFTDQILAHPRKPPRQTAPRISRRSTASWPAPALPTPPYSPRRRMADDCGTILLLHDGAELDYSGLHIVAPINEEV